MIILDWRYFCRRYLFDAYNTLSDYEEIKKVSDALEEKRNVLEESEMRWMELSEKMEG